MGALTIGTSRPADRAHGVCSGLLTGTVRRYRLATVEASEDDTGRAAPYPASDKTALGRCIVAWLVLVVSGVLESVWATALGRSEGFTRLVPSLVFFVALAFSMAGLAVAMRTLPTGTSYAVWVGIGAVLTVAYAMLTGEESASLVKVLLMMGIVGCVVGLKLVGH
jgi:quaternary ammonium compound-resistance protein SugE